MRPERASHSSRVSRLVAKHVKVLIVGAGGQGHVFFLSGTVHSRPQIGLLYSNLQELNFQRTVLVEFFQVAQDLRDQLVILTQLPVGCRRPEKWPQNEVADGDSTCPSHAILLHSLRTAASPTVLRRTTNEHNDCICILFNVSQRIVVDILLA
jgi:hypothetical protein